MKILRESNNWEFIKDTLYGVTCIRHKTIPRLSTLWNTGYEALEEEILIEGQTDIEFIAYCNKLTEHLKY